MEMHTHMIEYGFRFKHAITVATGHTPVPDQSNSTKGAPQNQSRVTPEL